jgi:S-adenosyl-L-methionine hydrolase (adenosine-forming)
MNVYKGMLSQLETRLARMERPPVVTLTTDFGQYDGYVGTMKGVIHTLVPDAKLVDISHEIAPQQINEGAFILYRAYRYFPASAVHIAVVDPGVGSRRRPIVLRTRHGTFVGPDNGIFTYILRAELSSRSESEDETPIGPAWAGGMWGVAPNWAGDEPTRRRKRSTGFATEGEPKAYHLVNPDYWLANVSTTFHGRDIFAPVAAHLASGAQPERMGELIPLDSLVKLPVGAPRVYRTGKSITVVGQIMHIDRFGNIITNLPERLLAPLLDQAPDVSVEIGGQSIKGLARAYTDVKEGQPVALIGSENLLEIAIRNSNAAHRMKVRTGGAVRLVVAGNE